MFLLTNVLEAVLYVVDTLLTVYSFVVIAVCLLSFVNPDPYNPLVRLLRSLTEPVLWRIRKFLPYVYKGGLDFSPVVLLIGIHLVKIILLRSISELIRLTLL